MTEPAGASATATWIARLSPAVHVTGYAGALMRAPIHAAFNRGDIGRPPLSPRVAAPSCANASARASLIAGSSRSTVASLAEGEGFEPSRGLVAPYSLSRRAPSATRSALRDPSIRAAQRGFGGERRSADTSERSQPRAVSASWSRASAARVGAERRNAGADS